jgi:hypothetical protein
MMQIKLDFELEVILFNFYCPSVLTGVINSQKYCEELIYFRILTVNI